METGQREPPGGCSTIVEHPFPGYRSRRAVSIGIVIEHRFAFYYWMECKQDLLCAWNTQDADFKPPDLITMDWHDDCGGPCDFIEDELARLDQQDKNKVALFCWAGLRPINDGHIAPAVWLNMLGNVYIVQRQHRDCRARSHAQIDRYGRSHHIFYFRSPADLPKAFLKTNSESGVIWDVDMDYFTQSRAVRDDQCGPRLANREIRSLIAPRSEWMQIILRNLKSVTIALEPAYTGGLTESLDIFRQWEKVLFDAPLFSENCHWKANLFSG